MKRGGAPSHAVGAHASLELDAADMLLLASFVLHTGSRRSKFALHDHAGRSSQRQTSRKRVMRPLQECFYDDGVS